MKFIKRILLSLLLLAVLAFGVLFSIQNHARAPLDLLVLQLPEQKVALWVLLAFAVGGLLGLLVSSVTLLVLRGDNMLLHRKVAQQEREINRLRNTDMPLVDRGRSARSGHDRYVEAGHATDLPAKAV